MLDESLDRRIMNDALRIGRAHADPWIYEGQRIYWSQLKKSADDGSYNDLREFFPGISLAVYTALRECELANVLMLCMAEICSLRPAMDDAEIIALLNGKREFGAFDILRSGQVRPAPWMSEGQKIYWTQLKRTVDEGAYETLQEHFPGVSIDVYTALRKSDVSSIFVLSMTDVCSLRPAMNDQAIIELLKGKAEDRGLAVLQLLATK